MQTIQQRNEKQPKKGKGIAWAALAVILAVANTADESPAAAVVILIVALLASALIAVSKKKGKNAPNRNQQPVHSHDRLSVSPQEVSDCTGLEHWKEQLDGFLAAGIIDRTEYRDLMKSHRTKYDKNGNYIY